MAARIRVGDIGTTITLTVKDQTGSAVDISTATVKNFSFLKPGSSVVDKTAQFTTDGTDGKLYYTFIAADLNIAGEWKVQAEITTPSGYWTSDAVTFTVYDPEVP